MLSPADFENRTLMADGASLAASRLAPTHQIRLTSTTQAVLRAPLEPGQYTSYAFGQLLDDHGVLASIGSVGDAFDNALAESFVDSFKTELIADRVWRSRTELELAVVVYAAGSTTTGCTKRSATFRPSSSSNCTPRTPRFRATDRSRRSHRGPQIASTRPGLSTDAPVTPKRHSQPPPTRGRLRLQHSLDRRKPTNPVSAELSLAQIYLAIQRAHTAWKTPYRWTSALRALKIHFGDRLPD